MRGVAGPFCGYCLRYGQYSGVMDESGRLLFSDNVKEGAQNDAQNAKGQAQEIQHAHQVKKSLHSVSGEPQRRAQTVEQRSMHMNHYGEVFYEVHPIVKTAEATEGEQQYMPRMNAR